MIDSHFHVWDTHALSYPWLDARHDLPAVASLPESGSDDGVILVEACVRAGQAMNEAEWMSSLAQSSPSVRGVVAAVDLRRQDLPTVLETLRNMPAVVGVRHNFEDLDPAELMTDGTGRAHELVRGINAVLSSGLTFDVCVVKSQWNEMFGMLTAVAEERGDAHGIVIDHAGKPSLDSAADLGRWFEAVEKWSSLPGLHVKLSGITPLLPETPHGTSGLEHLASHTSTIAGRLIDAFGPDRVMYGSDHPVSSGNNNLSTTAWKGMVHSDLSEHLDAEAVGRVLTSNTESFYGVSPLSKEEVR